MKRRLIKLISIMLMVTSMISSVTTYAVGCDPVEVPANTCETSEGSGEDCVPYGPQYIYRTEYFESYRDVFPIAPEDQSPEGVKLTNPGDGIIYKLEGGVDIPFNIGLTLPAPYNFITIGIDPGKVKSSLIGGYLVTLGDLPPGYYRLKLLKEYELKPYVVYRQRSGANNTEWEIDHVGCIKTYKSCEAVLEYVKP